MVARRTPTLRSRFTQADQSMLTGLASGSLPEGPRPAGAWGAKRVEPRCRLSRQAPPPCLPLARITPSTPSDLCYPSDSFGTCMCRGDQSRPESLPAFGPHSHPRMVISTADGSTPNVSARASFAWGMVIPCLASTAAGFCGAAAGVPGSGIGFQSKASKSICPS